MSFDIAIFLFQDGVVNGAIFALIAIGVVLLFTVSRVVLVSFGDLIAYSALTLASIQGHQLPGMVWLVVGLAILAVLMECFDLVRRGFSSRLPRAIAVYGVLPIIPVICAVWLSSLQLPMIIQIALTIALILPLGPLMYRVVFQPMANASLLTTLMAAVAVHFVLSGLALLFFGAEGYRTKPYVTGSFDVGFTDVSRLSVVILGSVVCIVGLLYLFFNSTLMGKALRATAVNAVGARIVGIRTRRAGSLSFLLATGLAALSGVLIGPMVTIYYDTGFMVGLKGFVGAVVGGFVSYPLALAGALIIGLIDAFSSFYSSAFKDVIVFASLIPIVIVRYLLAPPKDDEVEDES
ncbi:MULTISPECIES: branched-chain amino acid ABC transporter permease [unclassified Rhizobium]|uniref:branched-chain amino acid ABC transporter permease n=1 Tax=unclassified Rhizobium TaxID=2613769 RepID=UPI000BDCD1EA|nr:MULTISPECIES: branched-chain amino acid ABC transporter permease [unclassified Rhizobium]MDH7809579.1 branched-chain amino acid transport system permease protein [Rhizobium sp. AN67]SOD50553.1 amino acid/amide ABC transporter membrane protein 1, HAAT family [Rhizobium sp. AN6A]